MYFYFILQNIKQFVTKQTQVFVLFLVSLITAMSVILLSVIIITNYINEKEIAARDRNAVSLAYDYEDVPILDEDAFATVGEIKAFMAEYFEIFEGNFKYFNINYYTKEEIKPFSIFDINNGIMSRPPGMSENHLAPVAGRDFTIEEYDSGSPLAIVSRNLLTSEDNSVEYDVLAQVGETCTVSGKTFTIIQHNTFFASNMIEIPFAAAEDDWRVESFFSKLTDVPTRAQNERLLQAIKTHLGGRYEVPTLTLVDGDETRFNNTMILTAAVISLLSATTMILLYRYILLSRRKQLAVIRICGCSRRGAFMIFIGELLLLTTSVIVVVIPLFHFFVQPLLQKVFVRFGGFDIGIYGILTGVFLLILLLVALPVIIKYVLPTPVRLLKAGDAQ